MLLLLLLRRKPEVLQRLSEESADPGLAHEALVKGVLEMIRSTKKEAAFWTSGSEEDRERCVAWLADSRRSPEDPLFREAPHVQQSRRILEATIARQRKSLHSLAHSGTFDKSLRSELLRL